MEIFRVEKRKKNEGPFQNEEICLATNYISYGEGSPHPTPVDDGMPCSVYTDCWHCGCSDLKALKHWFGAVIDLLHDYDYVIKVFKTDKYITGKSNLQVMFDRKYQRPLKILPITKLLSIE